LAFSSPFARIFGLFGAQALRQLSVVALTFALVVFPCRASAQVSSLSNRQSIVDTAQEVLIEAAKIGFDEAGERIVGPNGWRFFKGVMQPVVDSLQQQYPSLSFGKPQDKTAIAAATQAANYLSQNTALQKLLVDRFDSLAASERELIVGERRIESKQDDLLRVTQAINKKIEDLSKTSGEASSELPVWIDLSDYYKQVHEEAEATRKARMAEWGDHPPKFLFGWDNSAWVAQEAMENAFLSKVAEAGKTFTIYRCKLLGHTVIREDDVIVAYPASEMYSDGAGRMCRNLVYGFDSGVSSLNSSGQLEPKARCKLTIKSCVTAGTWKEEEVLKREGGCAP